jgi:hypothetical protein
MGVRSLVVRIANAGLRPLGAQLITARDYDQLVALKTWASEYPTFKAGSAIFPEFAHRHNCGWPHLATATERTVELALADRWLTLVSPDRVTEIGAVTPYYWPRRIADVVDPADPHPLVTRKASIFDVSLAGRSVLSISTFEHIGIGDYGLPPDAELAFQAVRKLVAEAPVFLVTIANDYHRALDDYIFSRRDLPGDIDVRLLCRNRSGIGWVERPAQPRFVCPYSNTAAGSILVLHRGTALFS